MTQNYEIDKLDRKILKELSQDARTPFLELARKLHVSGGTIHVRFEKLKAMGIIEGSQIKINHRKMGADVGCFIGIILKSANDYQKVLNYLEKIDQVVEVYYTTGDYNLFAKILTKNNDELYEFLLTKLQTIPEIQSTKTILALKNPINRSFIP